MIRFTRGSWGILYYWFGGILRQVAVPATIYLLLVTFVYYVQMKMGVYLHMNRDSLRTLAGFVVFLLVFRVNQCMARQNHGSILLFSVFSRLEGLVTVTCSALNGAAQNALSDFACQADPAHSQLYDQLALASRINIVRLTLAVAISLNLHFRLLEAASDGGELEPSALNHVVFLYSRLQSLLYQEEMEVVDRGLCVMKCDDDDDEVEAVEKAANRYCAEVSRHCHGDFAMGERLFGRDPAPEESALGQTFAPVPKIVIGMLFDMLAQPLQRPWGYAERMLNICSAELQHILIELGHLSSLILLPLPLAYLQLCRVLLVVFSISFPMSISPEEGPIDNIIMPFVIMVAMLGLEFLGEMLENPFGNDDSDLDIMVMIHNLEVSCAYIFEVSHSSRAQLRRALQRPLHEIQESEGKLSGGVRPAPGHRPPVPPPCHNFQSFFRWVPMPTIMLEEAIKSHGHVDVVHQAHFGVDSYRSSMKTSVARSTTRGDGYLRVEAQANLIDRNLSAAGKKVVSFKQSFMQRITGAEKAHSLDDICRDPLVYCHYLVCIGVKNDRLNCDSTQDSASWERALRTMRLLNQSDAVSLVFPERDDTARHAPGGEQDDDNNPDHPKIYRMDTLPVSSLAQTQIFVRQLSSESSHSYVSHPRVLSLNREAPISEHIVSDRELAAPDGTSSAIGPGMAQKCGDSSMQECEPGADCLQPSCGSDMQSSAVSNRSRGDGADKSNVDVRTLATSAEGTASARDVVCAPSSMSPAGSFHDKVAAPSIATARSTSCATPPGSRGGDTPTGHILGAASAPASTRAGGVVQST